MKITVDANILFSCLIKKGITRKIWFEPEIILYSPKYLLTEFYKYEEFLMKKFSGTNEEFKHLSQKILKRINLIRDEELIPFLPAAASLIKDEKDMFYLACALKEDTIIWSNDKELKKQNRINVKTTEEMIKEFGSL